ncbi:hypothetical protein D3C76_1261650 [compost metagenome]
MPNVLFGNTDAADLLHQPRVVVTKPIGRGGFNTLLEMLETLIAETLGKVVQILGMFKLWGIGNLSFFEGFDDRFGCERHDIDSKVMAVKAPCQGTSPGCFAGLAASRAGHGE